MTRPLNFTPGPTALPESVLEQAREAIKRFTANGVSILELGHRTPEFKGVLEQAESRLRSILNIPESHDVMFMQGGARGQFAMVPMNLLSQHKSADYLVTGTWGEQAVEEAKCFGEVRLAAPKEEGGYTRVPQNTELQLDPNAAYVHYTTNNTVVGTQYHHVPETGSVPLVADASSDIAAQVVDFRKFGIYYAGAQKNLGIPGVTVIIVHKDVLERCRRDIPKIFQYLVFSKTRSLHNTAPTFPIFMVNLMLHWIETQGGVQALSERNRQKAEAIYGVIDEHPDVYRATVETSSRSRMNIVFYLADQVIEKTFIEQAESEGFYGFKGHRSVGGMRVSLYNAIPLEHAQTFAAFMTHFARTTK